MYFQSQMVWLLSVVPGVLLAELLGCVGRPVERGPRLGISPPVFFSCSNLLSRCDNLWRNFLRSLLGGSFPHNKEYYWGQTARPH